ncbi:MAG TPA: DMT family transporter [Paludibacteraceae bacterium]|jgi:drug/metabolite transporter (DMT)-like permease|nr:DMT family transporter [Paludibacteraceae bacterium]HPH63784.1 DMT family transporter [Paludibacteraceae bacterium]
MWIVLAIFSAVLLGIYDVFKKVSLKENAVIPVLTSSILISFLIFLPILAISKISPETAGAFYVPEITWQAHSLILLKSLIVLGSWISAYFGMKNIPITIYSPIRATQPIWTVIGAFIIFSERLSAIQFAGVAITISSFYMFSVIGSKEGISWKHNKWIWLILLATLLGTISGLYDKHLMQHFDRMAVQVYSTTYQAIAMLLVTIFLWLPTRKTTTPFEWRWSILGISLFLICADYVYYWALSMDDAMISIISTIRRSGAVVPFLYGAIMLHEKNLKVKSVLLGGVLLGVLLLYLGR